jgi:hypothetical protein
MIMPFDPDERCDANGHRDANTGADTDASTAHDGVDEQAVSARRRDDDDRPAPDLGPLAPDRR